MYGAFGRRRSHTALQPISTHLLTRAGLYLRKEEMAKGMNARNKFQTMNNRKKECVSFTLSMSNIRAPSEVNVNVEKVLKRLKK
jgi:hypothetical protein